MKKKPKTNGKQVKKAQTGKSTAVPKKIKKDKDFYVAAGAAATGVHIMLALISYGFAVRNLKPKIISNNPVYLIAALLLPVIVWLVSTDTDFWNYYNRKLNLLYLVIVNTAITAYQPIYTGLWHVITPNIFKIPTNPALTAGMVILLAQILIVLCIIIYVTIFIQTIKPYFIDKVMVEKIKRYKIKQTFDLRKDKEWMYDFKAVRDLDNGKVIVVKEKDRGVHTTVIGASGTGKTSSVFLTAIRDDLDQRLKNMIKRLSEMLKMILAGKAYVKGPWIHGFKERYVAAKPGHEKELETIKKRYKPCGITVVAPDNSIIEDVIRLAKARHAKVNVIDPTKKWGEKYDNASDVKIAPFYIDPDLEGDKLAAVLAETANNFSEVLVAINERNKKMEQYFRDISTSTSTNVAIAVMLANHIQKKQTTIYDIQECLNDFRKIKPYVDTIENHFGFTVTALDMKSNKSVASEDIKIINDEKDGKGQDNKDLMKKNPYYMTILSIKNELLGEGMEEMFNQARGLRMLLNKLLLNPRVREILNGEGEDLFNFEKAFTESEITIVNTAQEYGSEASTGLGLFFLLLQRTEVLRRPLPDPSPHILMIDEASQYMHSLYDDIINQYRKFGVYAIIAMQTLTQTEKNDATKYLKQVFMNAGTQILFGRLSADEMKIYSEIAGTEEIRLAQDTITQNSIFSDNPSITTSQRITPTQVNKKEGSDLRMRDFQEVNIFTIDEGRVLEAKTGKVHFINKDRDFIEKPCKKFAWEKLMPKKGEPIDLTEEEKLEREGIKKEQATEKPAQEDKREAPDLSEKGKIIAFRGLKEKTAPVMSQSVMNLDTPEKEIPSDVNLFSLLFEGTEEAEEERPDDTAGPDTETAAKIEEDDEELKALLQQMDNPD